MKLSKKEIYKQYGIEYDTKTGKILAPVFVWIRPVLVNGNKKIGAGAYHFSMLPTNQIFTVMIGGRSFDIVGTCKCNCIGCYATKGNYNFKSVKRSLGIKTILARQYMEWLERAIMAQIVADGITLCRIHAAGDFFSIEYAAMWRRIAISFPGVIFWTYTKNKDCENTFAGLDNANIIPSLVSVKAAGIENAINFGHVEYIMKLYNILTAAGRRVHVCFCGIEQYAGIETVHCTDCHCCAECEYVLFLEHSTEYVAHKDPAFPAFIELVLNQQIRGRNIKMAA